MLFFFFKQAPSGVWVVHALMLAAFLKSLCTRLPFLALQSKMLRSLAGRSQGQSAMTGEAFVFVLFFVGTTPSGGRFGVRLVFGTWMCLSIIMSQDTQNVFGGEHRDKIEHLPLCDLSGMQWLHVYSMICGVCSRVTMAEAVQNHVKSLNWGHRVQLQDK